MVSVTPAQHQHNSIVILSMLAFSSKYYSIYCKYVAYRVPIVGVDYNLETEIMLLYIALIRRLKTDNDWFKKLLTFQKEVDAF